MPKTNNRTQGEREMFKCLKKRKKKKEEQKKLEEKAIPLQYKIALDFLGTEEVAGKGNNPLIVDMFKTVMGKNYPDSTAWCAAFVGSCLKKAGYSSTEKLTARSYLKYGVPTTAPILGDIVVLYRGKKSGWQGHVGFYAGSGPGYVKILGGNQNDEVNITRYSTKKLLGYRALASLDDIK